MSFYLNRSMAVLCSLPGPFLFFGGEGNCSATGFAPRLIAFLCFQANSFPAHALTFGPTPLGPQSSSLLHNRLNSRLTVWCDMPPPPPLSTFFEILPPPPLNSCHSPSLCAQTPNVPTLTKDEVRSLFYFFFILAPFLSTF